ncbi:hypothetical protein [Brevundimonas sp. SH203]|uniref:hypothetical protein n=1 Tax=Brevundimonas sp. SH203 TaxID=345167 RepID=UPI001177AA71|nr:hypothetical protein [Brevundimonas sp. SH203]
MSVTKFFATSSLHRDAPGLGLRVNEEGKAKNVLFAPPFPVFSEVVFREGRASRLLRARSLRRARLSGRVL